ncbi:MAG: EAL domain-containing protein [Methylophagaceae bacterium]
MSKISQSLSSLWPSVRISFALILITISIILAADFFEILPNETKFQLEQRKQLSESLAIMFSIMANEKNIKNIRPVLSKIVLRNNDILSAGFRTETDRLLFSVGEHADNWGDYKEKKSTSTHVLVPIIKGKKLLGTVEIRFKPLPIEDGFGVFNKAVFHLIFFVAVAGFLSFLFFMLRTLRQIDPAAVIPDRVNSAFDTLSEGVVIIDEEEQIVLANIAFSSIVKRGSAELLGQNISNFSWVDPSGAAGEVVHPWLVAMATGENVTGDMLGLEVSPNVIRTLAVNSAPILDSQDSQQGVLLTFDDVTELELKKQQLQSTVTDLKSSQTEVERQNKELHYLATRDPLTNCLNRRSFNELFAKQFATAREGDKELSCLMVDIDHFKKVNDNYGHAVGDEVIKLLADILHSSTREHDVVGRYGGEEFCIVLPGLNVNSAIAIAERIRLKIKDESARIYEESGPKVTVSIGVASIKDNARDTAELNDQSDQALYVAKESGRNRVIRWSESPEVEVNSSQSTSITEVEKSVGNNLLTPDHSEYVEEINRLQSQVEQLENTATSFAEQLQYEKNYDKLTGLPNKSLFYDRAIQAVERAGRQGKLTAILMVDIDLFSQANKSFGREIADDMFVSFTQRLVEVLRSSDSVTLFDSGLNDLVVSRFDSSEIAILLSDLDDRMMVTWVAKRILSVMSQPIYHGDKRITVSCMVGISVYLEDSTSSDEMISHAAIARSYARKENIPSGFQFYDPEMQQTSLKQLELEAEIRKAIENEEWVLYYQPKMDITTGAINSVEALIRWQHPQRGLLGPYDFISLAEERGLIVEIGEWVIRTACKQAKAWSDKGLDIQVAVNLSAVQLRESNLADLVMDIIKETQIYPHQLELEVTETILMDNGDASLQTLIRLNSRGVSVAIDDFGTGYSSLSYLKRLPVTSLKIDRAFIKDIMTDSYDKNIVTSVISMVHGMDLKVIAEGVETQEQYELLRELSCDQIQGYLLSRPIEAENLTKLLEQGRVTL